MSDAATGGSISAVVPTFNDVGRVGDALDAIASQTLVVAEIIVADDGSDDGTEELVREFSAKRAGGIPVHYLRLPEPAGVVEARNRGISLARGEWIANCDSDDVWLPHRLERQMEVFTSWRGSRRLAMLGSYGYNMNDAGKVISPARMGPTNEGEYEEVRRRGGVFYVIHSSTIYRREDFVRLGGYTTEYGAADDYDFFCRMAELGVVINVPEPLVYYRKRSGSVQLARFWDQRRNAWRLAENQRRRAAGRPPLDREQFESMLASESLLKRVRRRRKATGMYLYRRGANAFVNGRRLRGSAELALAVLLDSARVRAGVRGVLRHRARRLRGG